MIINDVLKDYASLLCLYWSKVRSLENSDTTASFKDDWLQANWELIVERQIGSSDLYLEVYGDEVIIVKFSVVHAELGIIS